MLSVYKVFIMAGKETAQYITRFNWA